MNLTSILGFISLAGWIMVLAGAGIAISNAAQNRPTRGGIGLAALGLVIGVLFFVASSGLIEVGPTQIAVVFQRVGGDPATNSLSPNPRGPGVHIIVPIINEPILYSTERRTYTMSRNTNEGQRIGDDSIQTRTKDGQQVDMDVSVVYSIDPQAVNRLHVLWQNRFEENFVRPTVRSALYDNVTGYNVEELYGEKRVELQQRTYDLLRPMFSENGLILHDLLLREITFSEEFIKAIEAKQVEEQRRQQAALEAARKRTLAQGDADAAVTVAKGQADALIEQARGQAESIRVRAAAEAEALALINVQLAKNPQLIQWRYVENLSDNISLILLPSNSPFLFDLNQLTQGAGLAGSNPSTSLPAAPTPEPTRRP